MTPGNALSNYMRVNNVLYVSSSDDRIVQGENIRVETADARVETANTANANAYGSDSLELVRKEGNL